MHFVQSSGSRLSGSGRTERWRNGLDTGDRGAEVLAALARADRARAAADLTRLRGAAPTTRLPRQPVGRGVREVVGTLLTRVAGRLAGPPDRAIEARR